MNAATCIAARIRDRRETFCVPVRAPGRTIALRLQGLPPRYRIEPPCLTARSVLYPYAGSNGRLREHAPGTQVVLRIERAGAAPRDVTIQRAELVP